MKGLNVETKFKILFLFFVLALSNISYAQFTPAQNAYLKKNELLKNPDAENGVTSWVTLTKPEIATLDYFSGVSSWQFTLNNQTLSFCQDTNTSIRMQNALLAGSCRVKTPVQNIEVCTKINGTLSGCAPIDDSGEWELGTTPDVLAGSSTTSLCVRSTAPVTGIIRVDNCSLGESVSTAATSILEVALGGTGLTTAGEFGDILYSDGTGWTLRSFEELFQENAVGSDAIQSINGQGQLEQTIAIGTAGAVPGVNSAGGIHTINIPYASATTSGIISSSDWSRFDSSALPSPGTVGNVLTSDGTNWISSPPTGGGGGSGNMSLRTASYLSLTAGSTLTLTTTDTDQVLTVKGNSGAITLSSTPFGSTVVPDGTEIRIIGSDSTNTVELTNNDISKGAILNGNAILGKFKVLTLVYNQTLDRYIEVSRNF